MNELTQNIQKMMVPKAAIIPTSMKTEEILIPSTS